MKLNTLIGKLEENKAAGIRFKLPNGKTIAEHAHVTEVAKIDKHFIDCGGTFRTSSCCRLQTWVANDIDHRLSAAKLLGILQKAKSILKSEDLDVDIEHEYEFISQFPLEDILMNDNVLEFQLGIRHTECLAPEKCLPKPVLVGIGRKIA